MSEPLRLRYVNRIVGLFVILVIILMLIAALLLARSKNVFSRTRLHYVRLPQQNLNGLREGTEIYVLGRRIGEIAEMKYCGDGNGPPQIQLGLKVQVAPLENGDISKNSIVAVKRKFGVGEPYLEVLRPDPTIAVPPQSDPPSCPPRDEYFSHFQADEDRFQQLFVEIGRVRSAIDEVKESMVPAFEEVEKASSKATTSFDKDVTPAFESVTKAADSLLKTSDSFNMDSSRVLGRVEKSAANFDTEIARLSQSMNRFVEDRATAAVGDVQNAAKRVTQSVDTITPQTTAALGKLESAAQSIQDAVEESRDILDVLRAEAKQLPGATARVLSVVDEADDVVNGVSQHWLLRRYMGQNKPTRRVSPSAVRATP